MRRAACAAILFWWFALLDAQGLPVQVIDRFLTRADCEWGRTVYDRIVEASGREDRSVGPCRESA